MHGYLGRDKVWNEYIWSEIDKVVREEVGRIRVAQKAFPSTITNNVLPVTANAVPPGFGPLMTGIDQFQPFIELSREFVLTQAQVDGEENMHLASTLAKFASSEIATAEDALLFLGPGSIVPAPPVRIIGTGVTLTNQGAVQPGSGFATVAVATSAANPPPVVVGGNIIGAVAQGIAALNGRAQPGPYALFVPPFDYAQAFTPAAGLLLTPGDQINHVVTAGFYMVNSLPGPPPAVPVGGLPQDIGILVSLGGEPAQITLGTDTMTAHTFTDALGNYHFRVFERIQSVVRDARAFQTLQFP
jgi:uncharacterized linocin/CFP29 family protein